MKDRTNFLVALIFLAVFVIGAGVDTVYDPRQLRRTSDGPLYAGFHPMAASGNTVSNSSLYETAARMFVFDKTFCVSNTLVDSWMTITNTVSGMSGWHINKRIPGSNYPIGLIFSIGYTNRWELGVDYQDYDFVLAYNDAKQADFIRMTTNNTLKICADSEPSPGTNKSHLIVGSTNVDYELLRLQIAAQQSDALSIHKFNDVERGWVRFAQGADRTADWRVGMGDGINRYGLSFFNGGGAYCNRLNAGREVMRLDGLDTNLVWANDPGGSYGTVTIGTATNAGALWVNTPSLNTEYPSGLGVDGTYDSLLSTINLKAFGVKSAGGYGSDMAFWTTTDDSSNRVVTFHKNGDVGIKKTFLLTNDMDWIGGNVTYVPIGGDINTYITNAVDGDTLILASGDYTITDSIYVNKRLNIMGQGCGGFSETGSPYTRGTTIKGSAANLRAFVVATNNVRLANFSTLLNANNARSINTLTNLIGIVVENVFMSHSGNSMQVGIWINGSEVVFRDSSFYIYSGNDNAYGLYHINDANGTVNTEVDCYNVYGTVVSIGAVGGCFGIFNDTSALAHSMNLYHCYGKTFDGGSLFDYGAVVYSTGTGSATLNAYHTTFNGQDQDIINTDGTVNLYDCVLFNNLKSGTVNWQRAFYTTNLTVYGASTFAGPVTNTTSGGYANYQSSATGTNYFAGPVGIGIATPSGQFQVKNGTTNHFWLDLERYSVYIGERAGNSITTGDGSVGIGHDSLMSQTSGNSNTGIGDRTLSLMSTSTCNTAIGSVALENATGSDNVAIGTSSQRYNTTASYNTSVGTYSMLMNQTSVFNTAIGMWCLASNTAGQDTVAIGPYSLYKNTSGKDNVSIGKDSLLANLTGSYNVTIGKNAFNSMGASSANVGVGMSAGSSLTGGSGQNVFIGFFSGNNALQKVDAGNSIAIGSSTYTTASNQVVLGNDLITETLLRGNVGINRTAPSAKLDVNGGVNIGSTAYDPGANTLSVNATNTGGTIIVGQATTTTNGGILFGPDTSLYRVSPGSLVVNGTIGANSGFRTTTGMYNDSGGSISYGIINPGTTTQGNILSKNRSDAYPVTLIQNLHSSSTGDILQLQSHNGASVVTRASFDRNGMLNLNHDADMGSDPTTSTTQWENGGEWKYRSSATSEGNGANNRVHNRAAQVVGVGTDYTLTQTLTNVVFGTSGGSITLPSAGTYVLNALANHVGGNANDVTHWRLYDTNSLAEVPGSYQVHTVHANGDVDITPSHAIYTSTGSVVIALQAMNVTAARGTVTSTNTTISYMRCY